MTRLCTTALHDLHRRLNAKLVAFAGYEMPLQYSGIMAEHKHTREHAGLFDVSHMGQCLLVGAEADTALETLVTADVRKLALNRQTYSVFTDASGGILDDLIITRWAEDTLFLVVNAACKEADFKRLGNLANAELRVLDTRALIALQGPEARAALSVLAPEVAQLSFMSGAFIELCGARCYITCSGYTGEDGFEISCPNEAAETIAETLLSDTRILAIGLGARDSLRLEAGLCLYGHDLDDKTSPVEASLQWAIAKSRRSDASFAGAETILQQLSQGAPRKRVGFNIEGRTPAREGAPIFNADNTLVGHITSGGFSPSLGKPIAMGYVATEALDQTLHTEVRNKTIAVSIVPLPFVAQRYYRG